MGEDIAGEAGSPEESGGGCVDGSAAEGDGGRRDCEGGGQKNNPPQACAWGGLG